MVYTSPFLGANYIKFDWFVPKTGLAAVCLKRVKSLKYIRSEVWCCEVRDGTC